MSRYTTLLRYIVQQVESNQMTPKPEGSRYHPAVYERLGLDSYEIFDEAYRQRLNDKIIDHYFMREIGAETVELFSFFMRRSMNEGMPYFNSLYEQQKRIIDPLEERNIGFTETHTENVNETTSSGNDTTTSSKSDGTSNIDTLEEGRSVFSDTPMGMLSNAGSPNVENLDYATNVTYDTSHGDTTSKDARNFSSTSHGEGSGSRDETRDGGREHTEKGHSRPQFEILSQFSKEFLNIDMMVIESLEPMFMQVW